jgi:hypothetical protein
VSVEKSALSRDGVDGDADSALAQKTPSRLGFAPPPRPRKPLQNHIDFAAALSQELRGIWEQKRTSLTSLPLSSSFDPLELRHWEANLLITEAQRDFEGRTRFKATKQGRGLSEYFRADLSGKLLPHQNAADFSSTPDIRPMLQLLDAAFRSKSPRDGQFTSLANDGTVIRTDILVLPISETGKRADKLLTLIYAEPAQDPE